MVLGEKLVGMVRLVYLASKANKDLLDLLGYRDHED